VNSKLTSVHGDSSNALAAVTAQENSAVEILDSGESQALVLSEAKPDNSGIKSPNFSSAK